MKKLLDKIDQTLSNDQLGSDVAAAGKIWLSMAQALQSELDETQLKAIEVASRFWRNEAEDSERIRWLEQLCARMDRYLREGQDSTREAAINRIAAASLMTTTGLTHEMAEFMDEIGERANIDEAEMITIFERHVPGFAEA